MRKHNLMLSLLLIPGTGITAMAVHAEADPASPEASYSQEVQILAEQLVDKTWLVKSRFKKVTSRLQYWQELATQCVESNSADQLNFDTRACRHFARSISNGRTAWYEGNCANIKNCLVTKQPN